MALAAAPAEAPPSVLTVGESLFDSLPSGLFLGGAPLNVGVHLAQLGVHASVATRVGDDALGEEIAFRLAGRGVDTSLVQADATHRSGLVRVVMKGSEPSYTILDGAWDYLEANEELLTAARECDAVVFGSLAQRNPVARAAITQLATAARKAVFDANFRPPHVDAAVVSSCARGCWLLKLNEAEAAQVQAWTPELAGRTCSSPGLAALLGAHFGCHCVVTLGGAGAALFLQGRGTWTHSGCHVTAVDAVGAGDSFLACLLRGLLLDEARPASLLRPSHAHPAHAGARRCAGPRQRDWCLCGDAARRDAAAGRGRNRAARSQRAARGV